MYYFVGLDVCERSDEMFLRHGILMRFHMMDCKSMATPMETNLKKLSDSASYSNLVDPTMYRRLIGSLMYLVNTKLDICFAVGILSKYTNEPWQFYWVATKHVLRYQHGTIGYGLSHVVK
jgi:hypothetical protein